MPDGPKNLKGVTQRKKKRGGFGGQFKSTVMGTALFVAEMQRKVPLKTKLTVGAVLIVAAGLGAFAWRQHVVREEARQALATALERSPTEGASRVRQLLREGLGTDSKVKAIRYLGEARDTGSVQLLIEALDGPDEVVRAAAEALARIGSPAADAAREPLASTLDDAGPNTVVPVAWALASLGDERGREVSIEGLASGALQELDSFRPRKLAKLLGRDGLIQRLQHPHPTVRQFAAEWLGHACPSGSTRPLVRATKDDSSEVVVAASVSLARCDAEAARRRLPKVLQASPGIRPELAAAFVNEVGAPGLGILLASTDDLEIRKQLVERIADLQDPRAGDVLATELERVDESQVGFQLQIASALAEIRDPRTPAVLEPILEHEKTKWVREGIKVLAASGLGSQVEDPVVDAMRRHRELRGTGLSALGKAGACSEDAQRLLRRRFRSTDLRAAALEALGRCGSDEAAELALRELERLGRADDGKVDQRDGNIRFAAYDVIARQGVRRAADVLLETVLDPDDDPRMRTAAAHALGQIGDDRVLERAADAALDPDTSHKMRAALFRALRYRVPASALPRLMGYVRGGEDTERALGAAAVLGAAADPQLESELAELLKDERARNLAALIVAYGGLGLPEALDRFAALTTSDDALDQYVRGKAEDLRVVVGEATFGSDRFWRRLRNLLRLRERDAGLFWDRFVEQLAEGSDRPGALSGRVIRRRLASVLSNGEGSRRRLAAEALATMGARGLLVARRAEGGPGAAQARAALR